jgi:hypothetical protein
VLLLGTEVVDNILHIVVIETTQHTTREVIATLQNLLQMRRCVGCNTFNATFQEGE